MEHKACSAPQPLCCTSRTQLAWHACVTLGEGLQANVGMICEQQSGCSRPSATNLHTMHSYAHPVDIMMLSSLLLAALYDVRHEKAGMQGRQQHHTPESDGTQLEA